MRATARIKELEQEIAQFDEMLDSVASRLLASAKAV
jgi:cell division septum initiation protein DivIVA